MSSWELLKCSQNGAVAQPYFIISVILFLFSLENLVKPELTKKKRWARNYKAFSCQQIPHIWPLMTECTLRDVNVVAQSCVCRRLCVPHCALLCQWCLTRSTKHGGTWPAFLPLLCSSVFSRCPNTQLHPSSLLSCRYWASVRHEFPFFFVAVSLDIFTLQWVLHLFTYDGEALFWKQHLSQQYYSPKSSRDIIMSKHL